MSATRTIAPERLMKLVGTPQAPVLLDVRLPADADADPRLLPGAIRRDHRSAAAWSADCAGRFVVTICQGGAKLGHGAAAWLRHAGADAWTLEGGFGAWAAAGLPLVPERVVPPRDARGRTLWVTRARPKVDRIACPWLIRRFVDSAAVFLFVAAAEVDGVAERFGATAFDVDNAFWSHRGERCTFDVMVEEFGLATEPLLRLATMVRAADTARLGLCPQAAGLLAASLGLSRMYSDDLAQLEAGIGLYDAFYRWCRDATDEVHDWPANRARP